MRYSKRNIKGLPRPKETVIRSLSEYIKLFSDNQLSDYIFRGEPTNYHETISSALRNREYPFIQMANEFRREVYHKLTIDERSDFLAFAQHHGIPTNLIDFTKSPLVALFFACQPFRIDDERFDCERGFIYLLKNELIDITDMLSQNEDKNILELFMRNENNILLDLYKKIVEYEEKCPMEFYYYFKKLEDDWKYYLVDMQPCIPKTHKFYAYNDGEYKNKLRLDYVSQNPEMLAEVEKKYGSIEFTVLEYVLKLQDFLKQTKDFGATVWWLNCIPNFLYTPILSFERGRNQQGLFVYQAYYTFEEGTYGTHILSQQRVWPNQIIVVENKEKILQELDFMGINEKFIYEDYDNIAKYIKRKYE